VDELPAPACASLPFPRRARAWLPFLWSQVWFPGRSPDPSSVRCRSWLLLLVLPAALLYPGMAFHLFEPDEGRYAEIPREMLLCGEWVVPYLQGEPYLDKPPLLYWLVGLSYRCFGVEDWSARLVPGLAVHGCILLVYGFGRRILGEAAGFWGALLLSLAPGFVSMGRLLILDGLLTFCVTLALFAAYEAGRGAPSPHPRPRGGGEGKQSTRSPAVAGGVGRVRGVRLGWWMLAAVACGLGILAKGPVALLLLVPPLWAYRRLESGSCTVS